MYTSEQILDTTLRGEIPPRIPCICPGGMMNMLSVPLMELAGVFWPQAHQDPEAMAQLASAAYANGLFDNIGVPFCMTVEAQGMGAKVDLGDRYTEPRVTEYAIHSVEEWAQLKTLDLTEGRAKTVLEAIALIRKKYPQAAVMGNLTGPVSLASSLVDASHFYKEMRKKPQETQKVMDIITDNLLAFGMAQIEAGAEFITISDPSGTGEILGPKLFEQFALPCLNRLCRQLKSLCKGVIVHICGQLQPIFPQLERLECSALSVDAIVNIKQLRQALPHKVVMGNVSTFALAGGQKDVIQNLCRTCLDQGVQILAPACGLGTTTEVSSIRLLMEAAKERAEESHAVR